MELLFFKTQIAFKNWLSKNHDTVNELWVGYYKKATKKESITWDESVEAAICFGWIDGSLIRFDLHHENLMVFGVLKTLKR